MTTGNSKLTNKVKLGAMAELEKNGYAALRLTDNKEFDVIGLDINGVRLIKLKYFKSKYSYRPYSPIEAKQTAKIQTPSIGNIRKEIWAWIEDKQEWRKDLMQE